MPGVNVRAWVGGVVAAGVLAVAGGLWAAPPDGPRVIPYRGMLDSEGSPVEGSVAIRVGLWNAESGGTEQWAYAFSNVALARGTFQVDLGAPPSPALPAALFDLADVWLSVSVNGVELQGRQRIRPAAFSVKAQRANQSAGDFVVNGALTLETTASRSRLVFRRNGADDWDVGTYTHPSTGRVNMYFGDATNYRVVMERGGRVGIGTETPRQLLEVRGGVDMDTVHANGTRAMIFGGWYCTRSLGGSIGGSVNPLTGAETCPSGFMAQEMFATGGIQNCDASFGVCQSLRCTICYR